MARHALIRIASTKILPIFLGMVVLAACGVQGGTGSNVGFRQNDNQNFGNGSGNFEVNQDAFNAEAPQTPAYTPELKRCDRLRAFADSITGPCGPTINQFANELTRECYRAFNSIYNYECNGLENRLRNALNTCSSELSENFSFLPAACQNSLRRFFK